MAWQSSLTGSITGVVAGDNITATYASGATVATTVGVYSSGVNAIAATLSDPGSSSQLHLTQNLGTLTITQTSTVLSWATPAAITYGTPLSATPARRDFWWRGGNFCVHACGRCGLGGGSADSFGHLHADRQRGLQRGNAYCLLTVNKAPLTVTPNNASRCMV